MDSEKQPKEKKLKKPKKSKTKKQKEPPPVLIIEQGEYILSFK